jgi:DNA polymerase-3 subunit chi
MWEHPAGRFLPHSADVMDQSAPVRIGLADNEIPTDCEVVINLTTIPVPRPERFKRLLEIVPGNDSERTASRHKFRTYRGQGLKPASHTIGK